MAKYQFYKFNEKTNKIERSGFMKLNASGDERATLYFYGDICNEKWQSESFEEDKCPQDVIDFFSELDCNKPIDVFINSGGGYVSGGMAIYNILKRHKGEVVVYVDGLAASIASVIAMAGDRIVVPVNSELMIHKPWTISMGNAKELRKVADSLDRSEEAIIEVYLSKAKPGITAEQLSELLSNETWMTGREAANYFDVEVKEISGIAACISSEFYNKYTKVPEAVLDNIRTLSSYDQEDKSVELELLQLELDRLCL